MTGAGRSGRYVTTMVDVWVDVGAAVLAVPLVAIGLAEGHPLAAVGMAWLGGGAAVYALSDYRDVLRHRAGLLP
jgi:hypothetical protein